LLTQTLSSFGFKGNLPKKLAFRQEGNSINTHLVKQEISIPLPSRSNAKKGFSFSLSKLVSAFSISGSMNHGGYPSSISSGGFMKTKLEEDIEEVLSSRPL